MAASPESLAHLVASLKAGDKDAYRELVHHMGEPLLRYAAGITGDHDTAHDVIQDAFIRIYRLRRKLDEQQEFRGLCFRMVRNLARNAVRDESLRRRREQEASEMRSSTDTKTQALAKAAWEQVAKLPGALREVLELRFAFGLNRSEIASALEIPEGTVATRQRKGIEQVRNQMSVGAPALAALLAAHQPSTPTPDLFYLEELVMNGIRSMKVKAAGMVASAAMVTLLLMIGAGVTVNALVSDDPQPQNLVAQTGNTAHSAPGVRPDGTDASSSSANTRRNSSLGPESQRETPPDIQAEAPKHPSSAPGVETPPQQPDTPVQPGPQSAPELPEPEVLTSAPLFESTPITRSVVGMEYVYIIKVTAAPGAHLAVDRLPTWMQLNDNMLRGTPGPDVAGDKVPVTLTATNGVAPDAVQAFEITVNAPPVITSTPDAEAVADTLYDYAVTVTATPDAKLTLENAPAWLTLRGDKVTGTPTRNDLGLAKDIKLVADNGIKPHAEQVWSITVKGAPRFTSKPVETVKAGQEYRYEITVDGFPAPTIESNKLPAWLTLNGNVLSGTPRNKEIGKTQKIKLTAENNVDPDAEQTFVIEVEKNPDYVEVPWTLKDLKKFYKVGLKWVTTEHWATTTASGVELIPLRDMEVIEVDDDGVKVKVTRRSYSAAVEGAVERVTEYELTLTWDQLLAGTCWGSTDHRLKSVTEAKVKIGDKTYKCWLLEYVVPAGTAMTGKRVWVGQDSPGIGVKEEHDYTGKPRLMRELHSIED